MSDRTSRPSPHGWVYGVFDSTATMALGQYPQDSIRNRHWISHLHWRWVYGEIIRYSVGSKTRPIIIVDWSGLPNSKYSTAEGEHCILRATLAAEGRDITLYDEVHAKKEEGNEQVHRVFLKKLKFLLPQGCCPIIVTDAGFKNPWFKAVESLGWDYVGRVRGNTCCEKDGDIKKIPDLFEYASSTPKELGKYKVSKRTPLATNIYIYTHKLKGRKKYRKTGGEDKSEVAKKQSRGYRQPWVLISSWQIIYLN